MQPIKTTNMDESSDDVQLPLKQLEEASARARDLIIGSEEEAFSEATRRAEAILFAAGEPVSAAQLAEALPDGVDIADVLMALKEQYKNRGVNLVEIAKKWRFQTADDLAHLFVEERQVTRKLGQAALETLAIIAYSQPVTRAEIEAVRGVAVSSSTMEILQDTGWVRVAGRRKTPGQPMTYATTDAFLEHYGLESLDTLPGKADLKAQGLLSHRMPKNFKMPDEEALLSDEALGTETEETEQEGVFVTDFMEPEGDAEPVTEASVEETASAVNVFAYVRPSASAETESAETDDSASNTDPNEDASVVSVFSYTKDAPSEETDESPVEDSDEEAIQAAIIKLTKQPGRTPDRPMSEWTDED